MIDAYERILGADPAIGQLYESNYLKANSPCGSRALWLKHTVLRRAGGPGALELWAVLFRRDRPPLVAKREVPLSAASLDPERLCLSAGDVSLTEGSAEGSLADVRWSLRMTGGFGPLHHLPFAWMYRGSFPRSKILTPASNLRFDGRITVGSRVWEVDGWVGLRGHNWGPAHTHAYAYGNCNLWRDGARDRTVEGIAARVEVGPMITPWLTVVVGRNPDVYRNRPRDLWRASTITAHGWRASFGRGLRVPAQLCLQARPDQFVGLRYLHPDGATSYCYNTKFAEVRWAVGRRAFDSRCGELELLGPDPMPGVVLHPDPDWSQADGDYFSG
ncbi:MAG: hypothetical protein KTR31_35225 [Myxococcales bacterium]|nr:hypothetical protein [Myxococcales bacterium]